MRTAKVDEALELFDEVLKVDPGNGEAAANKRGSIMLKGSMTADLANKLFRDGNFSGALAAYDGIDLAGP